MADTSILNIICDNVQTYLTQKLQTEVVDNTQARNIHTGLYRDDISETETNVLIRPGGKEWPHVLNVPGAGNGLMPDVFNEIGGGEYWRRRFEVELRIMFDGTQTQDEARRIAQVILSRLEWHLVRMNQTGADTLGESVALSRAQVVQSYIEEGAEWAWNGVLRFEVMTWKDL